VCQTNVISLEALKSLLSTYVPTETRKIEARIHRISVPLQPPNSEDQARVWSQQFWPAVYKRSNPLGPQPAFLERAQGEIASQASYFMSLAWAMALEGKANRLGEAIGAVIVGEGRPIAVVADGRYAMRNTFTGDDSASQTADNILAHSALRGIALIAQKRLSQSQRPMPPTEYTSFKDYPITPVECKFYQASTLPENGYLCVDLDIYVTHEPCIMCSMALLHSRFRRVIFGKSMPRTGGLHSTNDGYGIWWRDELNWKILCWQWEDDGSNKGLEDETALSENIHV
jgi:tRNA-specific adenosine deaminase 3